MKNKIERICLIAHTELKLEYKSLEVAFYRRKEYAQQWIKSSDEEEKEILLQAIEDYNEDIKQYLSLW
jgi:hypothetical protein